MQRTLALLKSQGVSFHKTEQWISFFPKKGDPPDKRPGGVRRDLFNIIDVLAMYPDTRIADGVDRMSLVGIQVMGEDIGVHRTKAYGNTMTKEWLQTGSVFQFWSWRKRPKVPGSKMLVWKLRVIHISLDEEGKWVETTTGDTTPSAPTGSRTMSAVRTARKPKVDVSALKDQLAALEKARADQV